MFLTQIKENQKVIVRAITLSRVDTKRLFYLGIYPGATMKKIMHAPLHDPVMYMVQGACLVLRIQDAAHIEVEVIV